MRDPIPGYFDSGRSSSGPGSSFALRTVSPSGFFIPQAVLARNREGARPTEECRQSPTFLRMPA